MVSTTPNEDGLHHPVKRVCVVGSGSAYISGISYYTYLLSEELSRSFEVSMILMRRLVPARLYPGRERIDRRIADFDPRVVGPTFDGVDWWGLPSVLRAARFLRRQRPDAVVLQWWTGAVLPWYLLLILVARRISAEIVLEFHEDLDSGEVALPIVGRPLAWLVRQVLRRMVRLASRYVVHSEYDRERISEAYGLDRSEVHAIRHGPYPMAGGPEAPAEAAVSAEAAASAEERALTVLFFGTIRPYKGLEHLVEAFDRLPRPEGAPGWKLLIVGETWEGWEHPLAAARRSPFASEIEIVNRYVTDEELPGFFGQADIVALPYLRSSASGPLHLTMTRGLPVVVTDVGGLTEAADGYSGAVLCQPGDPEDLVRALTEAALLVGAEHRDDYTWSSVGEKFERLFSELGAMVTT